MHDWGSQPGVTMCSWRQPPRGPDLTVALGSSSFTTLDLNKPSSSSSSSAGPFEPLLESFTCLGGHEVA